MIEYIENKSAGKLIAHVVLAHGAGAPMDSPFMNTISAGMSARGIHVSRFEFPYMAKRRTDGKKRGPDKQTVLLETWRQVIAARAADIPFFIGGKSMGGRMASLIAEEAQVNGLVCLGYPFHPAGKPGRIRVEHLQTLSCPTLIVQGERDALGSRDEVAGYELSGAVQLVWMPDGDHSFKPRKRSGHTESDNLQRAVEAIVGFVTETRF